MKRSLFAFSVLLAGCLNEPFNCELDGNIIFNESKGMLLILDSINGKILSLKDRGLDSIKGGVYFFYPNGRLESYKFFQTTRAYTYNEEYDPGGYLVKVEGKPLVDVKIKEYRKDSIGVSFFLFGLHKIYSPVSVVVNNNSKLIISPTKDALFSNMYTGKFSVLTKELDHIEMVLTVDWKGECLNKDGNFNDTIVLRRDTIQGIFNLVK
jgi:hypothetical protein